MQQQHEHVPEPGQDKDDGGQAGDEDIRVAGEAANDEEEQCIAKQRWELDARERRLAENRCQHEAKAAEQKEAEERGGG